MHDRIGEERAHYRIGKCRHELSLNDEALGDLQTALAIASDTGDRIGQVDALNETGSVLVDLGQDQRALSVLAQAQSLAETLGYRRGLAAAVPGIGSVYADQGENQKALEFFGRGLKIQREVGDRSGVASTLSDIGTVYEVLGQRRQALQFYGQALRIQRQVRDRRDEAATLVNIGVVYGDLGEAQMALNHYAMALPILREVGDRRSEAVTLGCIGLAYHSLGQRQKALEYYARALPLKRDLGDRSGEATTMHNMGAVFDDLGRMQEALSCYARALPLRREVGDLAGEANELSHLGGTLWDIGLSQCSIMAMKMSVNIYGSLRDKVASQPASVRRSYAETLANVYAGLALFLACKDRPEEAEETIAESKTDSGQKGALPKTNFEARWIAGLDQRVATLANLGRDAAVLRSIKSPTRSQLVELKGVQERLEAGGASFGKYLDSILEESRRIDPGQNRIVETPASKAIQSTLNALPSGTAIVFALPERKAIHLIVVRRGHTDVQAVAAEAVGKETREFLALLQDPGLDPRPMGKALYDVLVKPIEFALDPHRVTMWCLNGSLRGLPIGALWDGRQYTFQRFSSTYFSPAFVPQLARSPSRNVGAIVAGVTGASVVKDPQMGLDVSCPALPAVRRETDEVAAALATKAILDRDFTIKNLLADLSGHPGVIHLASHFCYTPGDDARSFLLTGGNQAWTVEAIKALPEDALQGVDLVTLSACATNEGDSATGSEVESFAAWMQRKGRRGRSIHAVVSERREYCDPNG